MEEQLNHILRGCEDDEKVARTSFSMGFTHMDRRFHQMMFADRDYECAGIVMGVDHSASSMPKITIERCEEKGYSVFSVRCKDRAKLMFDIVRTLTDMQYVVFHATISSDGPYASQEYFIRHMDGCTLDTEAEKERVIKCIEATIQRRISEVTGVSYRSVIYMHASDDPFTLVKEAMKVVRIHLGIFNLLEEKTPPGIVDKFGWCTWDAFYLTVHLQGIWEGVKGLAEGG